jgi:hypothetical protein
MSQHAELSTERWARFDLGQQILQIGVEMHRGLKSLRPDRMEMLRASYERVLRLVDLTVEVQPNPHLRRELLLWRGVIAELYLREGPDPETHRLAFRVLLQLHPAAYKQIALLGL